MAFLTIWLSAASNDTSVDTFPPVVPARVRLNKHLVSSDELISIYLMWIISHYLQGFIHHRWWLAGFLNHQQYDSSYHHPLARHQFRLEDLTSSARAPATRDVSRPEGTWRSTQRKGAMMKIINKGSLEIWGMDGERKLLTLIIFRVRPETRY